ncbi:n-glutamine methyltransferase mtq2 [Niveomyces insectorum RCEF 264]|uniref:N-glutamine methyltransferase mtq2 n=1 Tax=Niveomyces insectorum RCEF 264 TaxID=1081102 RepID=A0A167PF28_9HYPO|nr:n-glutamine methyltransferase mtq2 [Niveomyces insectorum RCEF 264]
MLPTPDTSHVPYSRVYEPAEDSFLMLDTLALPAETAFLQQRFGGGEADGEGEGEDDGDGDGDGDGDNTTDAADDRSPPPLVVEVGSGSGVVLAFVVAQAAHLFGQRRRRRRGGGRSGVGGGVGVLALAVDVNAFACRATNETVRPSSAAAAAATDDAAFARDAHLLELAYAGGRDGMETTDRLLAALPDVLSARGCAYILLCAQNRPEAVKARIRQWTTATAEEEEDTPTAGRCWRAETVGTSGRQAGWEKLQIVRIWRE